MKSLMLDLYAIEAVKLGSFTLKSGIISPIYIDLRLLISYPSLFKKVTQKLGEKMRSLSFDLLCGVPYTALPMATALSITYDIPMVMRRKEVKDHGTKKLIEGAFRPHQRCLIIEDLITSGISILETVEPLQKEGLSVSDVLVVIDREQGGKEALQKKGLNVHALFTLSDLIKTLKEERDVHVEL
jgi:uridine monophosphate synthetase